MAPCFLASLPTRDRKTGDGDVPRAGPVEWSAKNTKENACEKGEDPNQLGTMTLSQRHEPGKQRHVQTAGRAPVVVRPTTTTVIPGNDDCDGDGPGTDMCQTLFSTRLQREERHDSHYILASLCKVHPPCSSPHKQGIDFISCDGDKISQAMSE